LLASGHSVVSVGKLHYGGREGVHGFRPEILREAAFGSHGWVKGLVRDLPLPSYNEGTREFAELLGSGSSHYTDYDSKVCDAACAWLKDRAPSADAKPWIMFVSFISPHYPLIVPRNFFDLYCFEDIGWPHKFGEIPTHPVLKELYNFFNYQEFMTEDKTKTALVAYYGLCSYVDHLIGRLLTALRDLNLANDTRVIYTSDHGEMLGAHGMWTKQVMYEDSAGIPLIMAGPGIPQQRVVDTPVSLVDIFPTVMVSAGEPPTLEERALPGSNLIDIAKGEAPRRSIISEYHDGGAITGIFMIVRDNWKYIHYEGYEPQLFDLGNDPHEDHDLAQAPEFRNVRDSCREALLSTLDPAEVTKRVFLEQRSRVDALGGRAVVANMVSAGLYH
jgi:choline-sulfatase